MHFLCLHGLGTNSHVLETQIATIRYELEEHHTFDFAEGSEVVPIAPEIKAFYPPSDTYYAYLQLTAPSASNALTELHNYIAEEGPFDGVLAFSQGASLASTYIIQQAKDNPGSPLPFRFAIFFSASRPYDVHALGRDELIPLESEEQLLPLPTAHIWGQKDLQYQAHSEYLYGLSEEDKRIAVVHSLGHEIPGARHKEDVQQCVMAIRRTVEKAAIEC